MRIRTALLAAAIAALPLVGVAQTATPAAPTTSDASAAAPARPHFDRAALQKYRADRRAKYTALSAEDKAKYDGITKQIRDLRHQQNQILGIGKS